MEMDVNVKKALENINFIDRYKSVSEKYSAERTLSDNRLRYIDGEEVIKIINECGYDALFDKEEKFFKINDESINEYIFRVHIIIKDGMIDLVWVLKENDDLILGSPLSAYSRSLIDVSYRIKKPVISDYNDIEDILKLTFNMYEDFKKEYVKIRSY